MNSKVLTRKELYDMIWATPMVKLATQFGLSDNGLKKKCIKHQIPRPPVGYWTKIECGQKVPQTPLPTVNDPLLETVEFNEKSITEVKPKEAPEEEKSPAVLKALEFKPTKRIAKYHPLVKEYREKSKGKYLDRYGHVPFGHEKQGINVRITAGSIDRVSRFPSLPHNPIRIYWLETNHI